MEIELDSLGLSAFLTVCATMNFTRAAHALHITQSALSHRIRRFEESIGVQLVVRDPQQLSLTAAGFEVLNYGRKKRALEDELKHKLASTKESLSANVRIGAFSSILRSVIMPALSSLIREHEHLNIEFFAREIYELAPMLMSGALDFAIITHAIDNLDFVAVRLFDERNVLIKSSTFNVSEIYLDHDPKDQTTMSYFQENKMAYHTMRRRYCDDIYGIIDGVRLGFGYAVAPLHLVQQLSDIEIINPERVLTVPAILHYSGHGELPSLHNRIVETLKQRCVLFV